MSERLAPSNRTRLSVKYFIEVSELYKQGYSINAIARRYGVADTQIRMALESTSTPIRGGRRAFATMNKLPKLEVHTDDEL